MANDEHLTRLNKALASTDLSRLKRALNEENPILKLLANNEELIAPLDKVLAEPALLHLKRVENEKILARLNKAEAAAQLLSTWNEWNAWREQNPGIVPDLAGASFKGRDFVGVNIGAIRPGLGVNLAGVNLSGADLSGANLASGNLSGANLTKAKAWEVNFNLSNLSGANLTGARLDRSEFMSANLAGADLSGATLMGAGFYGADLSGVNLRNARLDGAQFYDANLRGADLTEATLTGAVLVETTLENTDLTGCKIYGISAWSLNLKGAKQSDLVITRYNEPTITLDNLEVAQFIYLLLNNQNIRDVIDTITSKVVLILGRFTEERKGVLNALRDELRHRNLTPVIFDFDKPTSRDLTETISVLAHMARFIIADITDPKSIPQELTTIIPNLPSVPVQTLVLASQNEYGMYEHWRSYPWVLPVFHYNDTKHLLSSLTEKVIKP